MTQRKRATYIFAPASEQLFNRLISPDNAVALRTAVEKGKLMIALPATCEPWLKPSQIPASAIVIADGQQPLITTDADEVISDTGELTRNWQRNTPRTQTANGRCRIELGKMLALTGCSRKMRVRGVQHAQR
jgi:hypothetical protein